MGQNVVGNQIRRYRSAKGWTQEKLAAKCNLGGWDLSRSTLSKIEAGLRRVTDAEVFFLAKILRVDLVELYPKSFSLSSAAEACSD